MSKRLQQMIREYLLKAGDNGWAKLSVASGLSVSTLMHIEKGGYPPPLAKTVRKLALACGFTEEGALHLMRECASEWTRETA